MTRTKYDDLARIYDTRWDRYVRATVAACMEGLEFRGDERVLDAPVGTGAVAAALLERWPGLRITGVDLSPSMLDEARGKLNAEAPLLQADVAELPFPADTFDAVICVSSFHYFRRPKTVLAEFAHVLRPGGTLVILDWCDDYLACKLYGALLRRRDRAFVRTYTRTECEGLLRERSLVPRESRRFRVGWLWGLMRIAAVNAKKRGQTRNQPAA